MNFTLIVLIAAGLHGQMTITVDGFNTQRACEAGATAVRASIQKQEAIATSAVILVTRQVGYVTHDCVRIDK